MQKEPRPNSKGKCEAGLAEALKTASLHTFVIILNGPVDAGPMG